MGSWNSGSNVNGSRTTGDNTFYQNMLIYDIDSTGGSVQSYGLRCLNGASETTFISNCFIWDITLSSGSPGSVEPKGITHDGSGSLEIYNCSVHLVYNTSDNTLGFAYNTPSGVTIENCIGTDSGNADFTGTPTSEDYNLSSDASAAGGNSLTSRSSTNQFVSNSAPIDLHLLTTADARKEGNDKGTTNNYQYDIDGYDRDTSDRDWETIATRS